MDNMNIISDYDEKKNNNKIKWVARSVQNFIFFRLQRTGTFPQGMYNGAILGVSYRINDEVEERELEKKALPSLI